MFPSSNNNHSQSEDSREIQKTFETNYGIRWDLIVS